MNTQFELKNFLRTSQSLLVCAGGANGIRGFPRTLEARLLRDSDALSMASSLELRPVLLDDAIVEFVMSLPMTQRLQKKKLLLDATREVMPAPLQSELLARPKRGFTFP